MLYSEAVFHLLRNGFLFVLNSYIYEKLKPWKNFYFFYFQEAFYQPRAQNFSAIVGIFPRW